MGGRFSVSDRNQLSKERAAVLVKAAFEILHERGEGVPLRELKQAIPARVDLTPRDLETYEKSGYIRWESILHFYSIDCVKAGLLQKQGGRWYLTQEGEVARALPGRELIDLATRGFRKWKTTAAAALSSALPTDVPLSEEVTENIQRSYVFEDAESKAASEIEDQVRALGPYQFQDLVAALLRAMGYVTHTAKAGPDGGTDILASPDPLGAKTPHIRVQVKHRQTQKAGREEIAALRGIIRGDRETGLFVSSSGFTSEATREARNGNTHIELMDLEDFLEHWISYYERMPEEDKAFLRLRKVYFLAPN